MRSLPARLCLLLLVACGGQDPSVPDAPLAADAPIFATTWPLEWAGDRLLEGLGDVELLLPPGADPEHWSPARSDLRRLQGAASIAVNGAGLEPWLETPSLPRSRLVDTSRRFRARLIEGEQETHSHGADGEHSHAPLLPHVWLDPNNLRLQVDALVEAWVERYPDDADTLRERARAIDAELRALDARWLEIAPRLRSDPPFADARTYAYLTERYDFEVRPLEESPAAGSLVLLEQAVAEPASFGSDRRVVVLAPHGAPASDPSLDYLACVNADLDALEAALEESR